MLLRGRYLLYLLHLPLTVVGAPGNMAVIWAFLLVLYQQHCLLPTDTIVLHLACANLLVVGVLCLLETLASFRLANVFGDKGCQGVIFIHRTSRSLSIWLTFVLGTSRGLSITPPGSRWGAVRTLAARYLGLIFLCLWVISTRVSSAILFSLGRNDSSLMQHGINVQFCHVRFPSKLSKQANGATQVGRDVFPMALMALAGLITVIFLYKHSQQVKGRRCSNSGGGGGSSGGAEQRAAKAMVALVTLYVILYGVYNGPWVYTVRRTMGSSLISDLRILFSFLYVVLSPLVIIGKVNGRLGCVVVVVVVEKPIQKKTSTVSNL